MADMDTICDLFGDCNEDDDDISIEKNEHYYIAETLKLIKDTNEFPLFIYSMLKTLLQKSIENSFQNEAFTMQTGPASRNDLKLVKEHLKLLEDNKNLKEIYELFSNQILKKHHNNEL